ncbi:hypothetical protein F4824DRAFT_508000 [Ustulina deusta]|nr:hypothetical protein F4824DRAFT_508000 [Ustulina deusta]
MATNPSSGVAEGDAEKEAVDGWRRDISPSTRVVRDVTYKIIPFCSFLLVVFSIGAILVSTLSFDKPVPHQGALVISILLLSFFLLFGVGFIYLHFRKPRPHLSKCFNTTDGSRQDVNSVAGIRHSDKANNPVPRGSEDDLIRSDTLRDQAPSLNTYRKGAEESDGITQRQNVLHELQGSTNQRGHNLAQQHEHQTNKSDRALPSNPTRRDGPEAGQFPSDGGHNGSIQTNITPKPHDRRAYAHPNTHDTHENPLGSPSVGNLAQPPSVVGTMHHTAGPRNHRGIPIPPRLVRGLRDVPRHSASSQLPSLGREVPGPALPTSPDSAGVRSPQLQSPALEARSRDTAPPKPQTKTGERQRLDGQDDVSPWPRPPAKGKKMNKARDEPSIPPGHRTTEGRLAPPLGASMASVQASLEREAPSARTKKPSPYAEHDATGFTAQIQKPPQPKAREAPQVMGPGWLTGTRGPLRVVNVTASDDGPDPAEPEQARQKPMSRQGSEAHPRRRSLSSETADGMRGDVLDPSASTCSRIRGFGPRRLSAVPEPLRLVNKDERAGARHGPEAEEEDDDAPELPRPIPTPVLVTRPRPPTIPCRPPIYADGGGDDGGEEVPKTPVRAPRQKPIRGLGGGGLHRPRVPQRSSSRKAKRGASNTSRSVHVGSGHDRRT